MAVADRVWFVVSFVTTPGLKPAFVSLSDALRARPVNVVPFRTATVTWPRLTFAGDGAAGCAPPAPAVVDADAGGATVFGFAAGFGWSLPPKTKTATATMITAATATAAMTATSVLRGRPPLVGTPAPGRRVRAAAVRGGTVA